MKYSVTLLIRIIMKIRVNFIEIVYPNLIKRHATVSRYKEKPT